MAEETVRTNRRPQVAAGRLTIAQTASGVMLEEGKLPPQAVEVEQAVLGALMLDANVLSEIVDTLKAKYFYKPEHQKIYQAITELFSSSQPVDILTVTQALKAKGELELVGGAYYISSLTNRVSSGAHAEAHVKIIQQKYIQRELIRIGGSIVKDAYEDTTDVLELLDTAEGQLLNISEDNFRSDYIDMQTLVKQAIQEVEEVAKLEDKMSGVPSGFVELDRMTNGWQKGNLLIVAARPGMGKTAFALTMARNIAVEFKQPVAFFSLEMSAIEVVSRLISSEALVKGEKLKKGNLTDTEWSQLHTKVDSLAGAPLFIDETPALTMFELRAKCRRLKMQHNIGMVMIDYLQLMRGGSEYKGNREQEISQISRQLKGLAKELRIPIMALSQLSRQVETRGGDKKPQLSDLRESGAIEQDADMVMFIYRPEYYKILEDEDHQSTVGKAFILIEKHRSGSTGQVRLRWVKDYAKFENDDLTADGFPGGGFDGGGAGGFGGGMPGGFGGGIPGNTGFDSGMGGFGQPGGGFGQPGGFGPAGRAPGTVITMPSKMNDMPPGMAPGDFPNEGMDGDVPF